MSKQNINNLFQNAQDDENLSPDAMKAITVVDLGAQIQAGLGVAVRASQNAGTFSQTAIAGFEN